ncbi:MAG: transposase [Planctomycetota bacterium]|jgi:REP element-mobilizing transposase RayT
MGRPKRIHLNQDYASYHIVSRMVATAQWLSDGEKEEFLRLLERLARGFFVQIHAFCIMSNHFHLLVTGQEREASEASRGELIRRYRAIYGKTADPPLGPTEPDGTVDPDNDGGVQRLRDRLGSVSRFVQELKQTFSRRYNKRRGITGYLWHDRYKAVVTQKDGDAEISQAAYIDLNPIRAGMVRVPEDYRWSSAGLKVRSPRRAKRLLAPLQHPELKRCGEPWYRMFMYIAGSVSLRGKRGFVSAADAEAIRARQGRLGVRERFAWRCRNMSEGVALGSAAFVETVQQVIGRKHVRGRPVLDADPAGPAGGTGPPDVLCATRVLRDDS